MRPSLSVPGGFGKETDERPWSFLLCRDTLRRSKPRRGDAMKIPGLILKQMYTLGSLENVEDGVQFSLKNRLSNATVIGLSEVRIDGRAVLPDRLTLEMNGERV